MARRGYDEAVRMTEEARRKNGYAGAGIEDIRAADVVTKPVRWLWNARIPRGKLTMFDGDPDLGKSVVTVDIASRVSTGRSFPDGAPCEAGNVLIVNIEDGIEDTIVPRLKAHGADLDRVYLFSNAPDEDGGTRLLELPRDIVLLENKVREREAQLLIIDPVLTMLGGDANKDQDARKALAPIRDMAERTGAAIVVVRHLNKSVGLKAIQRGGGNMGLIGVARAGAFFAEHPDDDRLRVMAAHKSNLAEKPASLSYRIVSSSVHNTARVEWKGTTDHDANSLASGPTSPAEKSKQDEAKEFLRAELAGGPMWARQIFKDAHDAGISQGTLYLAKAQLRVRSEKVGTEGWQWSLPKGEDDKPPEDLEPLGSLGPLAPSKPGAENSAYLREDTKDDKDTKGAKDSSPGGGGYNLPGGQEPTRRALSVEDAAGELRRAGSGPAKALAHYLEKPNRARLEYLTRAVLVARGMDTGEWERHAGVTEAAAKDHRNHPLDCECAGCIL